MGALAGVPNLAPPTNLKIDVLWRKWRNNCKGQPCEDEVSVFASGGWQRNEIASSLYISGALTAGSDINMTDLTTEALLPLSPPQSPSSPNSQPVLHQWRAATKTSIFTVLPSNPHLPCTEPPPPPPSHPFFSSRPTPCIPISLPLNGPCVPLILRRV